MGIIKNILDGVVVVELFGELDHNQAPRVREELDEALRLYDTCDMVLDFKNVTFMDSSGIGVVLGRYKKVKALGRRLIIAQCGAQIKSILEMAGVFTVIPYARDAKDAVRLLEKEVKGA